MSFFKNLLGLKKKSQGHKLTDYTSINNDDINNLSNEMDALVSVSVYEYDVTFTEQGLGMKLGKGSDGKPYIISSEPGSIAFMNDVRKSDMVVAVNGNLVSSYQGFLDTFSVSSRPVTIT